MDGRPRTVQSLVKNPFQKHKNEVEEKKRVRAILWNAEEAARALEAFVEDMGASAPVKGAFVRASDNTASSRPAVHKEQVVVKTGIAFDTDDAPSVQPAKKRRQMDDLLDEMKRDQSSRDSRPSNSSSHSSSTQRARSPDRDDDTTTNIHISGISLHATEDLLCRELGRFGPIASVKLMKPRPEDVGRSRMSAFVAFMRRADAETTMKKVTEVDSLPVRLSWSRSVPIPSVPFYDISTSSAHQPFGALPSAKRSDNSDQYEITVDPPSDIEVRRLIHRVIEFVVLHGPRFEQDLMDKERNNPSYAFLFDDKNPAHIYYRWKLYSLLQGDHVDTWRTRPFVMVEGGATWVPPAATASSSSHPIRGQLLEVDRARFESILNSVTADVTVIGDAMVWIIDHADAAEEIIAMLVQSLVTPDTPLPLKLARLFLLSDVLHNSSTRVPNAWKLRSLLETRLDAVFEHLRVIYKSIPSRLRAELLRARLLS